LTKPPSTNAGRRRVPRYNHGQTPSRKLEVEKGRKKSPPRHRKVTRTRLKGGKQEKSIAGEGRGKKASCGRGDQAKKKWLHYERRVEASRCIKRGSTTARVKKGPSPVRATDCSIGIWRGESNTSIREKSPKGLRKAGCWQQE